MVVDKVPKIDIAQLRHRAEERLEASIKAVPGSMDEPQRLLHELQVHQMELEIQNEELRLARAELETALGKYTDLYEFAPVGYLTLDRKGIIHTVNLTGASLLGIERSNLNKSRFERLIVETARPGFAAYLEGVFTKQGNKTYEVVLLKAGKGTVFMQIEALLADSGLECNIVLVDIGEHKKAEALLKVTEAAANALLQLKVEAVEAMLKIKDAPVTPQGVEIAVKVARLKLEKAAEVARLKLETVAEVAEVCIGASKTAEATLTLAKTADTARLRLEKVAKVAQQKVIMDAGVAFQVEVERARSKEELQKREQEFRTLVEVVPQIVWITRPDGWNSYFNQHWVDYTGLTLEESYGSGWITPFHPDDKQVAWEAWQRAIQHNEPYTLECRLRRVDGVYCWWLLRGTAVRGANGEILKWFGTCTDIQELKQANDRSNNYSQRLIEMEEELRKKIARDLHDDIAQELTALGLNLAYVSKNLGGESGNKIRPILEDSRIITTGVSRSVRNLMVELHPLQLEDYGLAIAIRMHAEQFTNRFGIKVTVSADPQCPRFARAVENTLFRIVQEAMSNVVKHADAKRVIISLDTVGECVRLTIKDDGNGFVPHEMSPQLTGAGWGLTNMRERARLIGSTLSIHSSLGQGTTISLEIKEAV